MPPKRPVPAELADPHFVRGYNQRRLQQLESDGPIGNGLVIGKHERCAILAFVRARQGVVGELRVRTYLAWLPLAASKLGTRFLDPDRETPSLFNAAFPSTAYARGSRVTVAQCLSSFWHWKFEQSDQEFPSWLRIKLERWAPTKGAADMLSRDDVASIADHMLNFRDKAWLWTLFDSGCPRARYTSSAWEM